MYSPGSAENSSRPSFVSAGFSRYETFAGLRERAVQGRRFCQLHNKKRYVRTSYATHNRRQRYSRLLPVPKKLIDLLGVSSGRIGMTTHWTRVDYQKRLISPRSGQHNQGQRRIGVMNIIKRGNI